MAIVQQQSWTIVLWSGLKAYSLSPIPGAINDSGDNHRPAKLFRSARHIEGMQTLDELPVLFGLGNQIKRPRGGIDDGSAGNPDFRVDVGATHIGGGYRRNTAAGVDEAVVCQRIAPRVGIDSEHAVVLRCDVQNVMSSARNVLYVGHIQRLRVYVSIHRDGEQFTELAGIHVRRRENSLLGILTRACVIIVKRSDIDLRPAAQ